MRCILISRAFTVCLFVCACFSLFLPFVLLVSCIHDMNFRYAFNSERNVFIDCKSNWRWLFARNALQNGKLFVCTLALYDCFCKWCIHRSLSELNGTKSEMQIMNKISHLFETLGSFESNGFACILPIFRYCSVDWFQLICFFLRQCPQSISLQMCSRCLKIDTHTLSESAKLSFSKQHVIRHKFKCLY